MLELGRTQIAVRTKTSTILTSIETKPRILYELDRQPSKDQKFLKEKVNSSFHENFKKNFKTALFRAITNKNLSPR